MAAITGRCHCGHVQYAVAGPVIKSSYCDCAGCRRATGALKAPFVTIPRASLAVRAGDVAQFRASTGDRCDAHGVWCYCPKCGSPLFWKGHQGDELDVLAGTLDDTSVFAPKE